MLPVLWRWRSRRLERSLALEIRVGTSERGEVLIYVERIRGGNRDIGPAKRVSILAKAELCSRVFAFPMSCGRCAARMSWSITKTDRSCRRRMVTSFPTVLQRDSLLIMGYKKVFCHRRKRRASSRSVFSYLIRKFLQAREFFWCNLELLTFSTTPDSEACQDWVKRKLVGSVAVWMVWPLLCGPVAARARSAMRWQS
jgi:hypothetical protein